MPVKKLYRSFAGGEITPELHGRLDLTKFQTGVSECVNMIPLPHGPLIRRPPTTYVAGAIGQQTGGGPGNVFHRMELSDGREVLLEFTDVHTGVGVIVAGAPLTDSNGRYTFDVPLHGGKADKRRAGRVGAPDELLLANRNGPPVLIRRASDGSFGATTIDTNSPPADPPFISHVQAHHNTAGDEDRENMYLEGLTEYYYGATFVTPYGESEASVTGAVINNLSVQGAYNDVTVDFSNNPGAPTRANVFKKRAGVYAYIGQVTKDDNVLRDDNILGDVAKTPPEYDSKLNRGPGHYPQAVGYFEQRLWWGGTRENPQTLYASRIGQYYNMSKSLPTVASDSIEINLDALSFGSIRHIVPLSDLAVLTDKGEWRIFSTGSEGLTPTSVTAKTQGYAGAADTPPAVTSSSILYVQDKSHRIRELSFNRDSDSYQSIDLTIMAPHLFAGHRIERIELMKSPYQILWVLRDDGVLLSMTYQPDQEVFAWARHDFTAWVHDICVVKEGNEDILYLMIQRPAGFLGGSFYAVERMSSFTNDEGVGTDNPWHGESYLDCGVSYRNNPPLGLVSGLTWLRGAEVAIKADGFNLGRHRVDANGAVGLGAPYSYVSVGIPYTSRMTTLPLAIEGAEASAQGAMKNITRVHLRLNKSQRVKAGPTPYRVEELNLPDESVDQTDPPRLFTGEAAINIRPSWNTEGQLTVLSNDVYPMTIVSMVLEVAPGA